MLGWDGLVSLSGYPSVPLKWLALTTQGPRGFLRAVWGSWLSGAVGPNPNAAKDQAEGSVPHQDPKGSASLDKWPQRA